MYQYSRAREGRRAAATSTVSCPVKQRDKYVKGTFLTKRSFHHTRISEPLPLKLACAFEVSRLDFQPRGSEFRFGNKRPDSISAGTAVRVGKTRVIVIELEPYNEPGILECVLFGRETSSVLRQAAPLTTDKHGAITEHCRRFFLFRGH